MSDKVIPCRKAFTETILKEAQANPDIFVVTSDARGSVTLDEYAKLMPEQFVEVGIAEQNAVGVGAGLALAGKNVFVCGPACFYAARSLEQVKVDVAYSEANVKIIGVSGGVSYGAWELHIIVSTMLQLCVLSRECMSTCLPTGFKPKN